MINLKFAVISAAILTMWASAAPAGEPVPLPAAGIGGPVALIAVIGAAGAYKFFRSRQK
jgi:hypothetical protein